MTAPHARQPEVLPRPAWTPAAMWFEADAWRDPQVQREFLARVEAYRDEGPPPAEQRMSREGIRAQFGV